MGKHFWRRQRDDEAEDNNKQQPVGCMWGLVHALDYHQWHSNASTKIRRHLKYQPQIPSYCDWSPKSRTLPPDAYEVEKLIDEKVNPNIKTKRCRTVNKRSLKSRIKALISEDISKGSSKERHREGLSLQRTYSIHHLESLDGNCDKNRVIFFPRNVENCTDRSLEKTQMEAANFNEESCESLDTEDGTDVLEIFKVDKELFAENLQNLDEKIDLKAKFTKSRSFPVAELSARRKLKPSKLENKQREDWSFPKEDRFQEVDRVSMLASADNFGARFEEHYVLKRSYCRTSSLNESLEKYVRLFENSKGTNAKLDASKSLKLTTDEHGYGSMYFGRVYSLSNVESYYSDLNFGELGDEYSQNSSRLAAKDTSSGPQISQEEEEITVPHVNDRQNLPPDETWIAKFPENRLDGCCDMQITENLRLPKSEVNSEEVEGIEEGIEKLETHCEEITLKELLEQCSVSDSDTILQETVSHVRDFRVSEGLEQRLRHSDELDSSTNSNDQQQSLHSKSLSSSNSTLNFKYDKRSDKIFTCFEHDECPRNKNSDLCYIRHLLDQSGIATTASERSLQKSDHPLTPQLFEELESRWPHERDQLTGWPDFHGCWHHMMLFHVANEALHEMYDISLPYYPKQLSFSCQIRPFPVGNRISEAVCTKVSTFLPEANQSLDCIVAHNLANDDVWMNLQYESECIAFELEDIILHEILEEFICS